MVFDAKCTYNAWRPVTAIRNGDLDGNDATAPAANWLPPVDTPVHPECPCAHCIVAGARATVPEAAFGRGRIGPITMTCRRLARHLDSLTPYPSTDLDCRSLRKSIPPMASFRLRSSLIAGALAAIGASVCCVGPLVLLGLGIGGTWIGNLTALEPLRPWFIGATLLFLGLAFRRLYLQPPVCEPGAACAEPLVLKRQRLIFWLVALALLALLSVPWLAPLLL